MTVISGRWRDVSEFQSDLLKKGGLGFLVVFRVDENHFCVVCVRLQFVVVQPCLDIGNACLWCCNDFLELRKVGRLVQLIVVRKTVM